MLDDTVTQQESNQIFTRLDRDKTGKIDRKEFERFFSVDSSLAMLTANVEKMRWAIEIFHELNQKLQERG
jgi:Ca2+-binding EF-hand superfamily protein